MHSKMQISSEESNLFFFLPKPKYCFGKCQKSFNLILFFLFLSGRVTKLLLTSQLSICKYFSFHSGEKKPYLSNVSLSLSLYFHFFIEPVSKTAHNAAQHKTTKESTTTPFSQGIKKGMNLSIPNPVLGHFTQVPFLTEQPFQISTIFTLYIDPRKVFHFAASKKY